MRTDACTIMKTDIVHLNGQSATVLVEVAGVRGQPPPHHLERLRVLVHQHEPPPERGGHRARRTAAGEEVQAPSPPAATTAPAPAAARPRASGSGSRSSPCRPVGTIVCHHTSVGSLPRAAFSGADQPGREVGHPRSIWSWSKRCAPALLDVDQDRVVLGRPAVLAAAAVVVGPDHLVEEAVAAEDARRAAPCSSAPRASRGARRACPDVGRAAGGPPQPGGQEAGVVGEGVRVGHPAGLHAGVAAAPEAGPVARRLVAAASRVVRRVRRSRRPPVLNGGSM